MGPRSFNFNIRDLCALTADPTPSLYKKPSCR